LTERGNDAVSTAQLATLDSEALEAVYAEITTNPGHSVTGNYANQAKAEPATLVNWVKEPTSATATPGTNNVTIGLESNATSQD